MTTRGLAHVLTIIAAAVALAACGRDDPASLVASARNYLAKGDPKAAIIQLKNALQEVPTSAEARFLLAKSLLESGDSVGAETEARKALDLKYPGDEAYPVLASALLQQGELRKLVAELSDQNLTSPQAKAEVNRRIRPLFGMVQSERFMGYAEGSQGIVDLSLRSAVRRIFASL